LSRSRTANRFPIRLATLKNETTMTDTANLGLPCIEGSQAQKHVTHNDALRILDTLVQLAVLDRDLTAPPGSPTEGQRWIVNAGATDAWAGHDNAIAAWQDGAWQFSTPQTGWLAYVVDEGALLAWSGSAWIDAVAAITSLNNITLLGVGTTADTTNPFSAKLNNALWTAKTVAEGGDGDLRYKLNKEAAANTLSFLFQDNYSGRAEIGLTGDDDFHFKVSPDGSSWHEAIVIARSTGAVSFPQGGSGALWAVSVLTSSNAAWPVPSGTTELMIEAWGAGGSGAGGNSVTGTRGGGGGAGAYVLAHHTGTMDSTLNVTVGAGGAAAVSASGGTNGSNGGNTSIVGTNLGTVTARGGTAGLANQSGGGSGGAADSAVAVINIAGSDGVVGFNSGTIYGWGGDAPRGGPGGKSNVGAVGISPGGGGAAGNHSAGTNSGTGGNGMVVIWTR
jgi:hypothetical protein